MQLGEHTCILWLRIHAGVLLKLLFPPKKWQDMPNLDVPLILPNQNGRSMPSVLSVAKLNFYSVSIATFYKTSGTGGSSSFDKQWT